MEAFCSHAISLSPAELAKRYLQLLRTSAQQRYGDRTPGLGQPLAFHQAYVPPILQWSRASAPFPSVSSEPEQSQAVQGFSHGGRYAASPPPQRGGGQPEHLPPAAHCLHPWDTVSHSSLLLPYASKMKNAFSRICHCSWCFACFY